MKIEFNIGKDEFIQIIGRKPKNKDELDKFCHSIKKGMDAQLDWDIIYSNAKENL